MVETKRSLNTEFRPQSLEEFIGCQDIVDEVREGLKQGRVENTYLFSGPPGTGKTSIAKIIARLIQGESLEYYDIEEIETADLGIENMRVLVDRSKCNPQIGRYKCYIINEAQKLSAPAQTILLDALEEPSPVMVWFLCSSEPDKLSVAIRRRCTHFKMHGLNAENIAKLVSATIKRVSVDIAKKYLPIHQELVDALVIQDVTSPGLIIKAVEKFITGSSASLASQISEATDIDAFAIAKATASGNWLEVQKLLKNATKESARAIRGVTAGLFRSILIKEPLGSKRAERCVEAIKQLSDLANQNQFEEGLIWSTTCASLYNICISQKEYISKKV